MAHRFFEFLEQEAAQEDKYHGKPLIRHSGPFSPKVMIMTMTPGHQQGMKHVGDGRLFFFLEKKYT